MKHLFSEVDGLPYVLVEENDECEAVVDACLEIGAVITQPNLATRYVVKFPWENVEEYTGWDLRRKLIELRQQKRKETSA